MTAALRWLVAEAIRKDFQTMDKYTETTAEHVNAEPIDYGEALEESLQRERKLEAEIEWLRKALTYIAVGDAEYAATYKTLARVALKMEAADK